MAPGVSGLMTVFILENIGSVQKCHIIQLRRFLRLVLQAFGNQDVTEQSEKMLSLAKVICYGTYNRLFACKE